MRLLVNALSVSSLSGEHVLFGHLQKVSEWTRDRHEYVVLHQPGAAPEDRQFPPNVEFFDAPDSTRKWHTRTAWESFRLPGLMKRKSIEAYFSPSGTILASSPVPQFTLAQNPWCLVDAVPKSKFEQAKARLQRASYRKAYLAADGIFFNSKYMQSEYHALANGSSALRGELCYQGIDDSIHEAGAKYHGRAERTPHSIVSVSVMARWKGAETLVEAVSLLRSRGVPATAQLIGPWPDLEYRGTIEALIDRLQLRDCVTIAGKVSRDDLWQAYANARVFCLMSKCESFGIPAVEAQAFGTPVVGSNVCAMPEIGGAGGDFGPPRNGETTAELLQKMLVDNEYWQQKSAASIQNVKRFRWDACSRPLLRMLGDNDIESIPDCTGPNGVQRQESTTDEYTIRATT